MVKKFNEFITESIGDISLDEIENKKIFGTYTRPEVIELHDLDNMYYSRNPNGVWYNDATSSFKSDKWEKFIRVNNVTLDHAKRRVAEVTLFVNGKPHGDKFYMSMGEIEDRLKKNRKG